VEVFSSPVGFEIGQMAFKATMALRQAGVPLHPLLHAKLHGLIMDTVAPIHPPTDVVRSMIADPAIYAAAAYILTDARTATARVQLGPTTATPPPPLPLSTEGKRTAEPAGGAGGDGRSPAYAAPAGAIRGPPRPARVARKVPAPPPAPPRLDAALPPVLTATSPAPSDRGEDEEAMARFAAAARAALARPTISSLLAALDQAVHGGGCDVEALCTALVPLLGPSSGRREVAIGGGPAPIVHALRVAGEAPTTVTALATVMERVGLDEGGCMCIAACGGVQELVRALTASDPTSPAAAACVAALANTARNTDGRSVLLTCGDWLDVVLAVHRAQGRDADTAEAVCILLGSVALDGGAEQTVVAGGGVQAMVEVIRAHADRPTVLEAACSALQNLTVSEVGKAACAAAAGTAEVLSLLERATTPPTVRARAAVVAGHMAFHEGSRRRLRRDRTATTVSNLVQGCGGLGPYAAPDVAWAATAMTDKWNL